MKSFIVSLALVLAWADRARSQDESWPPVRFKHVVAYCYDFEQGGGDARIVDSEGRHHRGVIAPFTRNLLPSKHPKLIELLKPIKAPIPEDVDCFEPHHGLVFYDEHWKPVASVDLCFACSSFVSRPARAGVSIDYDALEAFFASLGIPVGDEVDYTKLFRQHQHPAAAIPESETSGGSSADPFGD